METIFITGATGFIGNKLVRELEGKYNLICLKRAESNIKGLPSTIHWIEGDITSYHLDKKTIDTIDYVIHSAAVVSFDDKEKENLLRVNIGGTKNTIDQFIGSSRLKRFIYLSSIAALGRKENQRNGIVDESAIWEESSINTIYAQSKHKAELEVYRGINESIPAIILNPSMILGKNQTGTYSMVKAIKKGLKYYPTGSNGFVDISDVIEAIKRSIHIEKKYIGERIIINGDNVKFKRILDMIAQNLDLKQPSKTLSTKKGLMIANLFKVISTITGKKPIINANNVIVGNSISHYDNKKSKEIFNDFYYTSIEESVSNMCR